MDSLCGIDAEHGEPFQRKGWFQQSGEFIRFVQQDFLSRQCIRREKAAQIPDDGLEEGRIHAVCAIFAAPDLRIWSVR